MPRVRYGMVRYGTVQHCTTRLAPSVVLSVALSLPLFQALALTLALALALALARGELVLGSPAGRARESIAKELILPTLSNEHCVAARGALCEVGRWWVVVDGERGGRKWMG